MIIQIISSILGIFVIVGVSIVMWKTGKERAKIDIEPNMPMCENLCRTEFTDGYAEGIVKTQLPRKNGCFLIEYYPIDTEQGEGKPRPNIQSMIVRKEFIKRLPRGSPSARREIIKFIGRSPADMPELMRETDEGKWMTKQGQLAFLQRTFGTAIPSGDEAIAEAMKSYARGQIPKNILQQIKEENAKFRELQGKQLEVSEGGEKK